MKNYIKPEVKINSFISEDVITTSGCGDDCSCDVPPGTPALM